MTQTEARAIFMGIIVVLFGGLFWLSGIDPKDGAEVEIDQDEGPSHSSGHHNTTDDGPSIGPA